MITIDDETKRKLNEFIDVDGKIIIADSMPDDLKAAIKYLNDNNVNLFSHIEDVQALEESEELNTTFEGDGMSDDEMESKYNQTTQEDYLSEDESNIETSSLEDLF